MSEFIAAKQQRVNIFAERNRGILFDILVFVANLFLMRMLMGRFMDLFQEASADDTFAKYMLAFCCVMMFVLPPAAAILKRWHFHQRRNAQVREIDYDESVGFGCLFNPIFYFCLNVVIMSAISAFLIQNVFRKDLSDDSSATIFLTLVFGGLCITIFQTYLVYRYFSPPKSAPQSAFLRSPQSETLADAFILLNMILFQVAWNLLMSAPFGRVSGIGEFLGRLFFLTFLALLLYFPPRILLLAEDMHRPATWVTMLLANSPVIFRVLIGKGSDW